MADENKPTTSTPAAPKQDEKPKETQSQPPKEKSTKKYFKSNISGLAFQVADSDPENPVAPEVVRFVPYYERYQGDRVKVGYLATDDKRVLDRLAADPNVEEISAKDYKEATGDKSEPAGY